MRFKTPASPALRALSFYKDESDGASVPSQTITASARAWSDSATFLVGSRGGPHNADPIDRSIVTQSFMARPSTFHFTH